MPVRCNFAHIPKPILFLSFTAIIALISSAVRKFIPNSRTCDYYTVESQLGVDLKIKIKISTWLKPLVIATKIT
jgi:hypothetical protein